MHPLPAHVRRLTDSTYLAAALGVFVLAAAIQLGLYLWLLRTALSSGDVERTRPAFIRWICVDVVWQGIVLAGAWMYVVTASGQHPSDLAWIAPPLAALLGTALPLQLVVGSTLRAARR